MAEEQKGALVGSVAQQRAKRLLGEMAENPFVTFVFEGDTVKVYVAGVDENLVSRVKRALEQEEG